MTEPSFNSNPEGVMIDTMRDLMNAPITPLEWMSEPPIFLDDIGLTPEKSSSEPAPKFVPSEKRIVKIINNITYEYEIFNVVDEYNSILDLPAIPWDFRNPPGDISYIVMSMIETMMRKLGLGLAANQVGLRYKIFVMGSGQYVEPIINPRILNVSGAETKENEGCLSYPGLFLKVKRPQHVDVCYYNINGQFQNKSFDGLTARVFLHEYDHLMGIRYTSYLSKSEITHAKGKVKANLRRIKKVMQQQQKEKAKTMVMNKPVEQPKAEKLVISIPEGNLSG